MGYWQCKDGAKVELIFDDNGDFVRFGDDVKQEDAEKYIKELSDFTKESFGK